MSATRSPFPATWRTPTPIQARSRPGSPWPSSSRVSGRDPGRRLSVAEVGMTEEVLAAGHVDAAVFALRPDYRAMLVAALGLVPGPSDDTSDALVGAAEAAAREALRRRPVEE